MTAPAPSGWNDFYRSIASDSPAVFRRLEDIRPNAAMISDALLDAGQEIERCTNTGAPRLVSMFADVLQLSRPLSPMLSGGGLLLAARHIEISPGAAFNLDFRSAPSAQVVVFAQEVCSSADGRQAPFVASITDAGGTREVDITPRAAIGLQLKVQDGHAVTTDVEQLRGSYDWGTPLRNWIRTILYYGAACYYSNPEIARSMFTFVMRITARTTGGRELNYHAAALLANLNTETGTVAFVPALDKDVYSGLAEKYANAAAAFEQQYQIFDSRALADQKSKDAAKLMLAHFNDASALHGALVRQAEANLRWAQTACESARLAVLRQQSAADHAAIAFQYGEKKWAREQIMHAVFEICTAVVTMAASCAAIAATGPAGGAEAGAAAAEGGKAIKTAGDAAREAKDAGALAAAMSRIAKALEGTEKMREALGKILETLPKAIETVQSLKDIDELSSISVPPSVDFSTDAQWDAFAIDAETLLKPAIDAEVPNAVEYLAELKKLAIYSKALQAAQVSCVRTGQEVLRLTLQQRMDEKEKSRIADYMQGLDQDAQAANAVKDVFFEREVNLRFWILTALQSYGFAFRYWALHPSSIAASIGKTVSELKEDFAKLDAEYAEALQAFDVPPAPCVSFLKISDTSSGPYAGVIAALRANGTATFVIPQSEPAFLGFDRFRLTRIRPWLDGVPATDEAPVMIGIAGSGYCEDRLSGKTFAFMTTPVHRAFRYAGPVRDANSIRLDGEVETRDQYKYFQPTPFGVWTLQIGDGVEASGLTSLTLEFGGSAIGNVKTR